MLDKFDRNINYARISLTDRCNFRCKYCMPEDGIEKKIHENILRYNEIDFIIEALSKLGITKIRFTGGEPLVRKDADKFICDMINKYKNIDFYLTTNAYFLKDAAKKFKDAGLKGINISLDSLDENIFEDITRGGELLKSLAGLNSAIEAGIEKIKINSVLSKKTSKDDIIALTNYAKKYQIDVRFIELMPIGDCASYSKENFVSGEYILEVLPNLKEISREDKYSPARYFSGDGFKGKIGLINPITCTFCKDCNRIRITSDGFSKPCLHSDLEFDLRPFLNDENKIIEILKLSISEKPEQHDLKNKSIKRNMQRIGG